MLKTFQLGIAIVLGIFAVTAVAAIAMKYTIHRKHFEELYPRPKDSSGVKEKFSTKIHREHKGIMTEYVHGLYFGAVGPGQAIRHTVDYLKDRFFSSNKMVSKSMGSNHWFSDPTKFKAPR